MTPLLRLADPEDARPRRVTRRDARDEAIPPLFRAHAADLIRLGHCLIGDRGTAEEVVQDAFVSLYRNWATVRSTSAPLPYLRACVVYGSRSVHRRRGTTVRGTVPLTPELHVGPGADVTAVAHDDAHRLADRVRSLPGRQREVVVCRYYLDLTERETAALLEISVGAVKKHANRAMARLHAELEGAR